MTTPQQANKPVAKKPVAKKPVPKKPTTKPTAPSSPTPTAKAMTFDEVENVWIQAGGNPTAAQMAAAVADAASGLNPGATYTNPDGTTSIGLWLVPKNGSPAGSTDPVTNARAAIQMSGNGQDWSGWCVAWSDNDCGCSGGTYLGDGSNALGALGQTGAFNVIGSSPTGAGTSASNVSTGTTPSNSKLGTLLTIVIALVLIAIVYFLVRRKTGESSANGESTSRQQSQWSPDEEAQIISSDKSDKELSADLGRSVRSIRVRRNQMKAG